MRIRQQELLEDKRKEKINLAGEESQAEEDKIDSIFPLTNSVT